MNERTSRLIGSHLAEVWRQAVSDEEYPRSRILGDRILDDMCINPNGRRLVSAVGFLEEVTARRPVIGTLAAGTIALGASAEISASIQSDSPGVSLHTQLTTAHFLIEQALGNYEGRNTDTEEFRALNQLRTTIPHALRYLAPPQPIKQGRVSFSRVGGK